jgi:hypothetical protein
MIRCMLIGMFLKKNTSATESLVFIMTTKLFVKLSHAIHHLHLVCHLREHI